MNGISVLTKVSSELSLPFCCVRTLPAEEDPSRPRGTPIAAFRPPDCEKGNPADEPSGLYHGVLSQQPKE